MDIQFETQDGRVEVTTDADDWAAKVEERFPLMNKMERESMRRWADYQRLCAEGIRDEVRSGKADWEQLDVLSGAVRGEIRDKAKSMTQEEFRNRLVLGEPVEGMERAILEGRLPVANLVDLVGFERALQAGMNGAWQEQVEASSGADVKNPSKGSLESCFNVVASRMVSLVGTLSREGET